MEGNVGEVSLFQNEEVSVIKTDSILGKQFCIYGSAEKPLFLARDVAILIEHSDVSMMLKSVDDEEKLIQALFVSGQHRNLWFLTEDGLYEVLMQSRKPIAKQFKKKVKEVLRSLRTNGGYIQNQENLTPEQIVANALIVAQNIINNMKPKADWYDKVADSTNLTEIGTVGKMTGIGADKIFKVLSENKIIYRKCDSDGVSYYVQYFEYEKYFKSIPEPFIRGNKKLVRNKLLFNQNGVVWATKKFMQKGA